ARCHNHKYDPITQKEYYQLSAYFNNIDESGHSFDQGNSPPLMAAPTHEQQRQLQQLDEQIAQAEAHYKTLAENYSPSQRRWEKSLSSNRAEKVPRSAKAFRVPPLGGSGGFSRPVRPTKGGTLNAVRHVHGQSQASLSQQTLGKERGGRQWFPQEKLLVQLPMDKNAKPVFNKSDRPHHEYEPKKDDRPVTIGFKESAPRYVASPTGQGVAFDGKLYFDAGIRADFRYKSTSGDYRERFTIAAWVYPETEQSGSIVTKVSDAPAEVENNVPRAEGYGLYFLNGKIHFNIVFRWGEDALRVETADPLPLKTWHHVAVVFDGLKQWEDRLRIYVNGREAKLTFTQRNFFLLFGGSKNTLKIGAGGGPRFRFKGALDEVRLYGRPLDADEVAVLACADSLETIAAIPAVRRSSAQALKLHRAYLNQAAPDDLKQSHRKLAELKQQKQKFEDDMPTLMVMQEMPTARPAFLLRRGAYDAPGESVTRAVPAALPPMPADLPNNRLGFARWLASREHPLTARVAVNRFWQMLFGTGLVKTTEDFGVQGELPSHPELLDWLAAEFRDGETGRQGDREKNSQWDVKALLKTMVMSATYRQSSKVTPQLLQRDPDNRLLARAPRFRLPAEMIRDQALFLSGLLVERLDGPSVKPYQPDGLYKDMAFSGLTGYQHDKGDGLWRRSLYTFWKRTVLSPTMQVFDASAREFCTVRETRTNTPLQSLNLMNDVTYIEAARLLAERMMKEGGGLPEQRLAWAFRLIASRQPGEKEVQTLLQNLAGQQEYFTRNPQEAAKLLAVGDKRNDSKLNPAELAAYATTASLLLNLDEVITKQ
ncbi:MAG: DUF1553 domain-containing protein, partial [Acidobacteriota bacterium]